MGFIDLHSHILPGLDDGASSVDETLAMLRLAHAGGTRVMVATPHCFLPPYDNGEPAIVGNSFRRLVEHLESLGRLDETGEYSFLDDLELRLGAENYVSPEFFDALASKSVVGIDSSRYLLVEFAPLLPWTSALAAIERIFQAGRVPVLAHVERYLFFRKRPKRLAELREMGCVAQLNAATLLGASGRGPARLASRLLGKGLIDVIASDGHGVDSRRPDLGRAAAALGKRHPEDRIALWLWENAARILEDKALAR